jgi:hypothetical protein
MQICCLTSFDNSQARYSTNKKARNAKDIAGEASWEAFKDRLHPTSE